MITVHFTPVNSTNSGRKEVRGRGREAEQLRKSRTRSQSAEQTRVDGAASPSTLVDDYVYSGDQTEEPATTSVQFVPPRNALNALHNIRVQADVIRSLSKKLLESRNRHGEALALCSAAQQLIGNAKVIISYEEEGLT